MLVLKGSGGVGLLWMVVVFVGMTAEMARGTDLMLQVHPGGQECFFEELFENKTLYVDFTVVAASQGATDIDFQISDIHGRPMITEFRRTDSRHELPITARGFYKICFDNSFSHFSTKTVAFTISVEDDSQGGWKDYDDDTFQTEGVYELQVNEIKTSVEKVKSHLNAIEVLQTEFRHVELKDRMIQESNFERVNFWSMVYVVLFGVVGIMQVYFVKSLFDSKYDVRRFVRNIKS